MSRGGKRTGSGAPRGNLNALTHGQRSKQIHQAIDNALQDPRGMAKVLNLLMKYGHPNG